MIKIKANKDIGGIATKGNVYEATELINSYVFKNDVGKDVYAHKSHFTVLPDEHSIEVGSEWIDHKGAVLTVGHVGKNLLICTWNESGREFASSIKNHLRFYKPKPKTVTMYFYYIGNNLCANDYMPHGYTQAFTREIELP